MKPLDFSDCESFAQIEKKLRELSVSELNELAKNPDITGIRQNVVKYFVNKLRNERKDNGIC